jgi:basic amino acid/polyamine antiporter, APA family
MAVHARIGRRERQDTLMELETEQKSVLLRRLGVGDAVLIVMGGIIGSGIFMNPSIVARQVHTSVLMMLAWVTGGAIALLGGSLFAELAARRPESGGLYAYVRDAIHPAVGFAYGWTLLFVSQGGGIAASAVIFSAYFVPLTGWHVSEKILASALIAFFTTINSLGVRQGATTQNIFMAVKVIAIAAFVVVGLIATPHAQFATSGPTTNESLIVAFGFALVPVLFAYNGYQTATFMTAELKSPARTLSRGLVIGVLAVVALYVSVNFVCLRVLGPAGLANTSTPASDVARFAFGNAGQRVMAAVVLLSTLGFISNQVLTAPRVCFQMAADGALFRFLARVNPRTHAPVMAIAQQGVIAAIIALSGTYEQILSYVVSVDFIFYALAGIALFIFRKRDAGAGVAANIPFRMPGFPASAALFVAISCAMVADIVWRAPREGIAGLLVVASGVPVYFLFARRGRRIA